MFEVKTVLSLVVVMLSCFGSTAEYQIQPKLLLHHKRVHLNQERLYKVDVDYIPNHVGSERVSFRVAIPPAKHVKLTFDVTFCENFDFAKGGKLHGLGSTFPVSGGAHTNSASWSARILFKKNGYIASYIYHQGMTGKYGDSVKSRARAFFPSLEHKIEVELKLNSSTNKPDGYLIIRVDGTTHVTHENLLFYAQNSKEAMISNFLFSTFFGGNDITFAPRGANDELKMQCAQFGNFLVSDLADS